MDLVFAIDPGNTESGYCIVDREYGIHEFGKLENRRVMEKLQDFLATNQTVVIERVASYGMKVGQTVFETCEWIGRYSFACEQLGVEPNYIYRIDEKMTICHSPNANDSSIMHALIARFAKHDRERGKGTKQNPDTFYGFRKDMWAAFAVAVTYLDGIYYRNVKVLLDGANKPW